MLRGHGDKNSLFALSSILRTPPPDWVGMAARLLILMAISKMVSRQPRPRIIGCLDYPFTDSIIQQQLMLSSLIIFTDDTFATFKNIVYIRNGPVLVLIC